MAQVIAQKLAVDAGLARHFVFDSAGTHAAHLSERIDPRAQAVLTKYNYNAGRKRSRRVTPKDFQQFDLILAMDASNLRELQRICPPDLQHKLKLFLGDVQIAGESEVPDPYYGSTSGFERVLALCEAGARHLLNQPQTL